MSSKSLTDFPNWLSPMLVKELRQGLRTNMFSVAFILLQAFMVICILIGAASPGSSDSSGAFWTFVVISLLIIQPLRGFNALSSEYQLNTMDLIQLTRLDTWRITLGKWIALNAQTLLLFTSILPYLVMRYFLGSVNFVYDLGALGAIVLGSGLASAVTIGCSAFKNYIVRCILLIVSIIAFCILFVMWVETVIGRSSSIEWPFLILSILVAIYGIFFFLSFGASRIASPSENLATRKRIIAVIAGIIAMCFAFWIDWEVALTFAGFIFGLSCIDALTERPPVFGPVLKPFSKKFITRFLAWFFAPGWHTGIFYFILCSSIWGAALFFCVDPGNSEYERLILILAFAGTISFPLIFIHLFFKKTISTEMHFGIYLFAQACLAVVTILVGVLADTARSIQDIVYACIPIPSVIMIGLWDNNKVDTPYFLVALLVALALSIIIPCFHGRKLYWEMHKTLRKK